MARTLAKAKEGRRIVNKGHKQRVRHAETLTQAGRNIRKGCTLNKWNEDRMKSAIDEFRKGEDGLRQIARAWNVPKTTLARRVKGIVSGWKHKSGKHPVLPVAAENELHDLISTMSARGFPFSRKDIQRLAFQYAHHCGLKGFNNERGSAGYYWMRGFLKRHNNLSCRKPEPLSTARAVAVNKPVIDSWFDKYEQTLEELQIKDVPSHIWNADESGLQDYYVSQSVVGVKGKACYEINPGEKGETTTLLATFNAVGDYAPLMFIFKGKRLKAEWCVGAPVDSIVRVSDNGWITSELFLEFGRKFVSSLPQNDTLPHLLLLDGHSTHVYNMEFLRLMKQHNVHPFCFPPHTTHCLQPADVALFKSMKHHWTSEGRKYMRQSGGKKPDKKQFFKLFQSAWNSAATVETAQSGFRQTGTFPVNRNAIPVEVFEPSKTTERDSPAVTVAEVVTDAQPSTSASDPIPSNEAVRATTDVVAAPKQGTSGSEVASSSQAVTATEMVTDLQPSTSTSDTVTASGLI